MVDEGNLEHATERLVEQVASLSGALRQIGAIQERQVELTQQVKSVREDLDQNAVPRHEFADAQRRLPTLVRVQTQRRLRVFAIGCSIFALFVSGVASFVAYKVDRNQRVALCQERNREAVQNATKTRVFFAPYVAQEKNNPKADPVLTSILNVLIATPPQRINCK